MTETQPCIPGASDPQARITADLHALLAYVAETFDLGCVRGWSALTTGCQDCNVDVRVQWARVVVKIFADARDAGIAVRTADLISRAQACESATHGFITTRRSAWRTGTPAAGSRCW